MMVDLRTAIVIAVTEESCEVWLDQAMTRARFAPVFPSPRHERVSPGHLVAVSDAPDGEKVVVWRWYDAVVLGAATDGGIRVWEPAHGEVVARPRPGYSLQRPGERAYLSAGLPGADWWVAAPVGEQERVDIDAVAEVYFADDEWARTSDS